jgi:hypothetical protein
MSLPCFISISESPSLASLRVVQMQKGPGYEAPGPLVPAASLVVDDQSALRTVQPQVREASFLIIGQQQGAAANDMTRGH